MTASRTRTNENGADMGLTPLQEVLEIRIDNSVQSSIKAAIDAYLARRLPHRIVSMSVT